MLVGLTGRIGAGKDTVADRLELLVPGTFERRSFAAPLKRSFAALFDITLEDLERAKRSDRYFLHVSAPTPRGMTMRELLQRYGTEAHREVFGTDFWLDQTLPAPVATSHFVVITDCRFPNEAQRVKDLGGTVWEVCGPQGPMDPSAAHASDRALPPDLLDGYLMNTVRDDGFAELDRVLRSLLTPSLLLGEVIS